MTQYVDLSTKTIVASGRHVRAIGWLGADVAFRRGAVAKSVISRIHSFALRWQISRKELWWPEIYGNRICEICGRYEACGYFGVPAGELLYVVPEMVLHYVRSEGYAPPTEFCRAVSESPLPGTPEYRSAVKRFRDMRIRARCPDYYRWMRAHKRFPGVKECLRVVRLPSSSYDLQMGMGWELYENAKHMAAELLAAYESATDRRSRLVLLSVMADAMLAEAVPVFAKNLQSADGVAWHLAVCGLRNVANAEARAALRKAHVDKRWPQVRRSGLEEE